MSEIRIESLTDAFLALRDVSDDEVSGMLKNPRSLSEGTAISLNASKEELDDAKELLNQDSDDIELEVIDPDADSLAHLRDKKDYIGQIILRCNRCKSNRFIDADKLVEDESGDYNVEDECPFCHSSGDGYEIIGQVGKVADKASDESETEENAAEDSTIEDTAEDSAEVTLDNDAKEDEVSFENDFKETSDDGAAEVESEETVEAEANDDDEDFLNRKLTVPEDEEKDGMETDSVDDTDDELPEESEDKKDDEDDDVKESFIPKSMYESVKHNNYSKEAWLMNKVIESMNNEDAYYGSWLYIWPDGEKEEDVIYDFGDKESFDELRDEFIDTYKAYHSDGLFDPDEDTIAYAHKQDHLLGLSPIDIFRSSDISESFTNSFDSESMKDLFDIIIDPDTINVVEIYDSSDDKNDKLVYKGTYDEIPLSMKGSKVTNFGVGPNEALRCDIDSSEDEYGKNLGKVLASYRQNSGDIELCDRGDKDAEITVDNSDDAITNYGYKHVVAIQPPQVLRIYCICPEYSAIEDYDDKYQDANMDLIRNIYTANNLSEYKQDKPLTNEYWIKECVMEKDDLQLIYEQFVEGHGAKLINQFKSVTGYKTELDEVAERHGLDLSKLSESASCCEEDECEETKCDDDCEDSEDESESADDMDESKRCTKTVKRDFKTRKELSEAIAECKNNNKPYTIRRSSKPGFRYELVEASSNELSTEVIDNDVIVANATPEFSVEERKVLNKIYDISKDIAEAIENNYNITADESVIAADIIQDLNLIAERIRPEDLPDTVANAATKQMYANYSEFYDFVDAFMSAVTGESIHTTPAEKLLVAIRALNSPAFSKENINRLIGSEKFIDAVRSGDIAYVRPEMLPSPADESLECDSDECEECEGYAGCDDCEDCDDEDYVDIDIEQFESDINEYFNSEYDDTVYFTADDGSIDSDGNIVIDGTVMSEGVDSKIRFTFKPQTKLNESIAKDGVNESIKNISYIVTNNISEETFEFTFNQK